MSKKNIPTQREDFEGIIRFTETYKKFYSRNKSIREAQCLKTQFPHILRPIEEEDLFAGRLHYYSVGFTPQHGSGSFGYYLDRLAFDALQSSGSFSEEEKNKLAELRKFWEKEDSISKVKDRYTDKIKKALPSDNYDRDQGIAFPLYRMAGSQLDYKKILRRGIPGLIEDIRKKKTEAAENSESFQLYTAMELSLEVFADSCLYYAHMADRLLSVADGKRKKELSRMKEGLITIAESKPETFYQAMQMVLLYSIHSGSHSFGRMDDYLGDFYVQDVDSGLISEEEALEMLSAYWKSIIDRVLHITITGGRIIIGGMGRENEANADRFALLAMKASNIVRDVVPQLSLRFHKGSDPRLMEKALELIGEGTSFPMLYNDDVNVPSVQKAFNISYDEAMGYIPYGCGEYIVFHKGMGTPSGVINLLKALEVTLHNGVEPTSGKQMGLALGRFEDFTSFDHLVEAYEKQVEYYIEALALQEELEYRVAGEDAPYLYMSMLYDDCIERGKGMFQGGVRYLGGTMESYGNVNTADSLYAIKKSVYDNKIFTQKEMLEMLDNDFVGFEKERKILQDLPKYGNDIDDVDEMASYVHNQICRVTSDQTNKTSLHSYHVVVINNSTNVVFGELTQASADGRKNRAPMANANNPSTGMDKSGITAFLNSLVKMDTTIHAGSVQNLKFSREMFQEHKKEVEALLTSYFVMGGSQLMINVLGKEDLENAMVEPEKYANLIVRVGGFSIRYIELSREIQLDILQRTMY
ncbi:MAG: hypothetical protein B6241_03520 [Spirochaetaceae bacterium 4572_59]|nr:MAG: hypothetical protein B6241_03520 [Spirochaetaceae bacterium 4572_59]